jgi:glycine/D-amino acid oxidase-like deaminating enzyme
VEALWKRAPPRPPRDERVETALLVAVLEAPEHGGSVRDLAHELAEPEAAVRAAAAALEQRGLAHLGHRYVAASGPALDPDALWPLSI